MANDVPSVQKTAPVGQIILHRFNGDEVFVLEHATISVAHDENGSWLRLEAVNNGSVIKSLPDTEILNGWPAARIAFPIISGDIYRLTGTKFSVPLAYSESAEDYVATFYYVEHEPLNANEIEFLELKENKYLVRWIGQTQDVNYYDGSKADAHIEIEGWFTIVTFPYSALNLPIVSGAG